MRTQPIADRWKMVIAMHFVMAISGMVLFAKGVFFPSIVAEFGFSHAEASVLFSINSIAGCVTALLVGWALLKGADARLVLLVPMLVLGAANIVAATAHGYAQLVLAYILMGSFNICAVAMPVLVSNWFAQGRGVALGAGMSGSTTSGVLLAPMLGWIVQSWGWRAGFLTIAASVLILLPPLILTLIRTHPATGALSRATTATSPSRDDWGITLRQAVRTPSFWLILAAYASYMTHTGAYLIHFVPSLSERHFSLTNASIMMSALYILAAASKFLFGYLADRGRPAQLAIGSLLAGSVGLTIFANSTNGTGLTAFTLLYGLTYSVPIILFPMIVQDMFGRRYFPAIDATLVVGAIAVGGWLGPLLIGLVYDRTHSYEAAFQTLAIVPAIGAAAAMLATRFARGLRRPAQRAESGGIAQLGGEQAA